MAYQDALKAADAFRTALLSRERAAAVRLVNAYGQVYVRLQGQVDALTTELDAMQARGEEVSIAKLGRLDRWKSLRRQIEEEVTRYGAVVESEIDQGAREALAAGQRDAKALTQAALPGLEPLDAAIMTRWQSLPADAVESLLGFLSEESPLRSALREKLGPAVAERATAKMIEGIALGYNPRKVASGLRLATGEGLTWSLTTARTAALYAYRESSRASWVANQEIVPKWRWTAARNEATCMSCLAMDGTVHPVTEPLNDHHNGRCAAVPVTVSYRELGIDVEEPAPVLDDSGLDWFKSQPEVRQKQQMGPEFWDAWKAGRFDLPDFPTDYQDEVYGQMRRAKTLEELTGAQAGKEAA